MQPFLRERLYNEHPSEACQYSKIGADIVGDDAMLIRSRTLWLCTGLLVLACITRVDGQLLQVVLQPDCTDLIPAACTLIPETDANGKKIVRRKNVLQYIHKMPPMYG
ncbi:hypothetical protein O6H91_22G069600 [Diphasiastrum complanatum]|uniref:Uncharacterized protein n=1 Tax=Diphasiastrum complanatum TaxID=34168 RepID=A0ACC2AGR1_DIPCM|nr:hypothetical protein O6H91_22G069600 [Diphasiastrum complanatum]